MTDEQLRIANEALDIPMISKHLSPTEHAELLETAMAWGGQYKECFDLIDEMKDMPKRSEYLSNIKESVVTTFQGIHG